MVASLKGGVGKTMVTAEIARAMARRGLKTGILDLDYSAPNIDVVFDCRDKKPIRSDNSTVIPPEIEGIKIISFGQLWPERTAVMTEDRQVDSEDLQRAIDLIEAGRPENAIQYLKLLQEHPGGTIEHVQMLLQPGAIDWGDCERLVLDTPPESGGIVRIVAESPNIFGAIVVCQPSRVSLADAIRTLDLFRKKGTPIIGLLSNQGTHRGEQRYDLTDEHVFHLASEMGISFLGAIPHENNLGGYFDIIVEYIEHSSPRVLPQDTVADTEWKPVLRAAKTAGAFIDLLNKLMSR
jgi:ATP-binding protein involved in chromosome partitioning